MLFESNFRVMKKTQLKYLYAESVYFLTIVPSEQIGVNVCMCARVCLNVRMVVF